MPENAPVVDPALHVLPALPTGSGCLLAMDTATEVAHVAVWRQGEPARAQVAALSGGAQASATALPGLQALLGQAGTAWSGVRAVAFGQGPGAFTGLRTACSLAQGLALALDVPVVPVDTLMAVAESARRRHGALQAWLASASHEGRASDAPTLWVLQDARMQEVYAAAYGWSPTGGWQLAVPVTLWPLDTMQQRIASGQVTHAAGSALAAYPQHVQGLLFHDAEAQPDGLALASLAERAWSSGQAVDAALALPVYVRDKVAQTTAERTAARAQAQPPGGALPIHQVSPP